MSVSQLHVEYDERRDDAGDGVGGATTRQGKQQHDDNVEEDSFGRMCWNDAWRTWARGGGEGGEASGGGGG